MVVVKHGPNEDIDAVVVLRVAPQQHPLQVSPHSCMRVEEMRHTGVQTELTTTDIKRFDLDACSLIFDFF